MNTTVHEGLEEFRESLAPERFELSSPSNNTLLPSTNASVSKGPDKSVELDWSSKSEQPSPLSVGEVFNGMEESAKRLTSRFPKSARAHANLGIALLKNGQSASAVEELKIALQLDSRNYIAGITLARIHVNEGRAEEARALYEDLHTWHPFDAAILMGISHLLIQAEQYDEAHRHLLQVVELNSRDPLGHFLLGLMCLKKSDLRCAINEFKTASKLDLRNPHIHHAIGVAYSLQGDHLKAEKSFKTALALSPHSSAAVLGLARTLIIFRKYDQAVSMLENHLAQNADDLEARDLLAHSHSLNKHYSSAITQVRQILELGKDRMSPTEEARHHTNIAVCMMGQKNLKGAEAEFKLAIRLSPNSSDLQYVNLARVYAISQRAPQCVSLLLKAIELFPSSHEARSLLTAVFADTEEYWRAIDQFKILTRDNKLSADNYAVMGSCYGEVGQIDAAIEELMEGYSRFPTSLNVINNLAYFLLMDGQLSRARELLDSRPRNAEDGVEMMATIGLLHLAEGKLDSAKNLYKQAERLALRMSNRDLARRVRQKMHLELARDFARRGELSQATREIQAGLQVRLEKRSFRKELASLANRLSEGV